MSTLDEQITPLVKRLNDLGIETFQSCSGHIGSESYPSAHIWVERNALTDNQADILSRQQGVEEIVLRFGREREAIWEIVFEGETLPQFDAVCEIIICAMKNNAPQPRTGRLK